MIYVSKPHGTHGVFHSKHSQGAYVVHKLIPGHGYQNGPPHWSDCGTRDSPSAAFDLADQCDENRIEPLRPRT